MKHKKFLSRFLILGLILICPNTFVRSQTSDAPLEEKRLETMHSISSQPLYDYVAELTSEKYEGRFLPKLDIENCIFTRIWRLKKEQKRRTTDKTNAK